MLENCKKLQKKKKKKVQADILGLCTQTNIQVYKICEF